MVECAGHAQEGWTTFPVILKHMCSAYENPLFDAVLNVYRAKGVGDRIQHKRFCGDWQFITASANEENAVYVDLFVTRLLRPEFVRPESDKNYVKDDGEEPNVSTLPATSTVSWVCYVQVRRTRSSSECAGRKVGKDLGRTLAVKKKGVVRYYEGIFIEGDFHVV